MKYVFSLILILFTTVAAHAAAPGFSQGSQFLAVPIQGVVTVYCSNGDTATYTCYDRVLDPSSYDYFVGPEGVRAQEITLSCVRPDGSSRERTEEYDTKGTKSLHAFNLWINTPFQRPLLGMGMNKIDYRMSNMGKIIQQGTFTVNVAQGTARTCPTTHYNSADRNDCQSPYTVCQRYFEQYDYCH